jgi:hypothetical protein
MTAAEAAGNRATVALIARGAHVRAEAVVRALTGLEVLPRTYAAVQVEAELAGVTGMPPLAPRAPRVPPVELRVARLVESIEAERAENVRLTSERDFARGEVATLRGIVAELRAELRAELGAAAALAPKPAAPTVEMRELPQKRLPAAAAREPRLAAVPPSRPVVTLDLSAVPPDALVETG